ncbi:uncharacterized protein LOC115687317 [Syzygium oleosum]|uniref:uncharacterized protein LOC115687317 n=1 Tax=Syzygium oleosum TaxID=219896 RepID=UPI0024B99AC2|nr:uncharacterized protein LOC115687317 [Syzygium oleosum]
MKLFIKFLPYEYRHRLVGVTAESLNRLVPVGERIEMGLHDGWFTDPTSTTKRLSTRKEKEPLIEGNIAYTQTIHPPPIVQVSGEQQPASSRQPLRQYKKRQFTPLPGSLSQVLTILRKKNLLSTEPKRPNSESFSNYDLSKKCDYHMGEVGHSTNDCYTLKHRVQNLLDTKAFSFQTSKLDVQNNPLPEHENKINAIFSFDAGRIKNVRVYTTDVYKGLVKARYYPADEVLPLARMKERVAKMAQAGLIAYVDHTGIVATISQVIINWDEELSALNAETSESIPTLVSVPLANNPNDEEELTIEVPQTEEHIVIEILQPYQYENDKAIPWSYELDVDLVTRLGRTYAQADAQPLTPVTDEKAKEFLAIIKANEYNVVDKLCKLPAQNSLLELLKTFSKH